MVFRSDEALSGGWPVGDRPCGKLRRNPLGTQAGTGHGTGSGMGAAGHYVPHVLFDEEDQLYKMWYAAGCNHEPDAIGYASSPDGIHWEKYEGNPVLSGDKAHLWEQHKVVAPCVIKEKGWFYMFYVGHLHEERHR